MTRVTKVGIWLVPWYPVFFLAHLLIVLFGPTYEATGASVIIDYYRRWAAIAPHPEWVIWILPVTVLLSLAASVIGCALLLISLVRKLWRSNAIGA